MIKLVTAPSCENCEFFKPEVNTIESRTSENQSKFEHYITCTYKRCCSKNEYDTTRNILLRLHNAGGCGAEEKYFKGWDDAIDEAIHIVTEESGMSIEEVI